MVEEFVKEIKELLRCKQELEYIQEEKRTMSNELYKYMMKEYEKTSYEDRCKEHIKKTCSMCRYRYDDCDLQNNFPEDIWKPIESNRAWIPGRKSCDKFQWS